MKKLTTALLTALLLLNLAACGEKEPDDTPSGYDDSLISELYSEEGEYTDAENNTLAYSYHVPRIVSETAVAAALNDEIADQFGALVQEQKNMMASRVSLTCLSVTWTSYWNDSLLCLVVRAEMDGDTSMTETYSYDFFGGKRLMSEDLLARCELSTQDFITAARRTAANYFDETYRDALSGSMGGADFIASYAERRAWTLSDENINAEMRLYLDGGALHMIVPVGGTNQHHMPTEFFGVYRPEGENTILPCTWHETGISLWGRAGDWRYEVMFLPGLDSDRFGDNGWVSGGAGSPYEFKIANAYAGAFRIDNYSVPGLRLSLSGYAGNSFSNTLSANRTGADRYKDVKGTVMIGAFDFLYDGDNWIVRGNFDYGHLTNSDKISLFNRDMPNASPSPKQYVGSDAIATGVEAGYDIFSQIRKLKERGHRFYVFGRYEFYDSMFDTAKSVIRQDWCGRQRVAVGFNYYPIKNIVIKAEYGIGLLRSYDYTDSATGETRTGRFNNEPSLSLGIAYSGFFRR